LIDPVSILFVRQIAVHCIQGEIVPAITERLEARVSREQKQLFQHAAELRGVTLTDFLVGALQEAARKTIEDHNVIRLAAKEQKVFVQSLMNPPAPNGALKRAVKRYRKMVAG
jgi:uncharacterized protein (DUF1778 family)